MAAKAQNGFIKNGRFREIEIECIRKVKFLKARSKIKNSSYGTIKCFYYWIFNLINFLCEFFPCTMHWEYV